MKYTKPYKEKNRYKSIPKIILVDNIEDIPKKYDSNKEVYIVNDFLTSKVSMAQLNEFLQNSPCNNEEDQLLRNELNRFETLVTSLQERDHNLSTLKLLIHTLFPTMDKFSILKGLNDRLEYFLQYEFITLDDICQFVFHATFIFWQIQQESLNKLQTKNASLAKKYQNLPQWEKIESCFKECAQAEEDRERHLLSTGKSKNKRGLFPKYFREKIVKILIENECNKVEKENKKKPTHNEKKSIITEFENTKNYQRNFKRFYDHWKTPKAVNLQNLKFASDDYYNILWQKRKWPPLWFAEESF